MLATKPGHEPAKEVCAGSWRNSTVGREFPLLANLGLIPSTSYGPTKYNQEGSLSVGQE